MILPGSPALLWEWKVLVCRDSHQQIECADFFFLFCKLKPAGDPGVVACGEERGGLPCRAACRKQGFALSAPVNSTVLKSWRERDRLVAQRLDFILV